MSFLIRAERTVGDDNNRAAGGRGGSPAKEFKMGVRSAIVREIARRFVKPHAVQFARGDVRLDLVPKRNDQILGRRD